jgi:hypothetical protein
MYSPVQSPIPNKTEHQGQKNCSVSKKIRTLNLRDYFTQRHRDRRPSTTACLGCWEIGTNKVKKCAARKIIFCILADQSRQVRTTIYCNPFICTQESSFATVMQNHRVHIVAIATFCVHSIMIVKSA